VTARHWWWWAVVSLVAFVVLTMLVIGHHVDHLDDRIRHDLNPTGTYGPTQRRALRITDWLRPTVLMALFAVLAILAALVRRSLRPLLYAGSIALATAFCELALKWGLPRIGSDDGSTKTAGSFPSGHVLCAVIVAGGVLLMLFARTRWWQWIVAAVLPTVMVVVVMVSVLHWASDVLGGLLLGVFLVSASALTPLRPSRPWPWRTGTRPDVARPARSRTS
jgi:membrane-associated phospholipid phosphatase